MERLTSAPCSARRRAVANPTPLLLLAPVTMASFPWNGFPAADMLLIFVWMDSIGRFVGRSIRVGVFLVDACCWSCCLSLLSMVSLCYNVF